MTLHIRTQAMLIFAVSRAAHAHAHAPTSTRARARTRARTRTRTRTHTSRAYARARARAYALVPLMSCGYWRAGLEDLRSALREGEVPSHAGTDVGPKAPLQPAIRHEVVANTLAPLPKRQVASERSDTSDTSERIRWR